jgi:hypothetical protein
MTFLQPWYLLGIFFTAVPIIIHLWFHKRLKKIPFSTLQFLKKSEAKRLGWLRFREIIILLLRCLFIAFLFLSLAKPKIKSAIFKPGRLASVFIIVDNSYSMGYGENLKTAKGMAHDLFDFYSQKSEFLVLPLCPEAYNKDKQSYWVDKKEASELTDKIKLSYKSGNIKNVLSQLSIPEPKYNAEYVYIGDGQESNFKDFAANSLKASDFYWLRVPAGNNIGISGVTPKDPISIPQDNYKLIASITSFSADKWSGKVTLRAKDYYYEKDCEIQPEGMTNIEFLLPSVIRCGKLVLYDDSLIVDNTYFFSKLLPSRLNVLIVGNERFLQSGLKPTDEVKSPFYIKVVENLSKVDIRRFNTIILNGIYDISESDKIKLYDFMSGDQRSVICFLGSNVGATLAEFIEPCCQFEKPMAPKGYVTLDWVNYTHPIFRIFVNSTVLKNIKIYRFQKLSAQRGVIAKLPDNNPFIIINNNLAVVATQFVPEATDLVYKTAFVPLLYRLILNTTFTSYDREFYIGQKVNTPKKIKAPTGEYIPKGKEFLIPGFYTIDNETIGVNVVTSEGNLKALGDETAKILNIQKLNLGMNLTEGDLTSTFLYCSLLAIFLELLLLLIK